MNLTLGTLATLKTWLLPESERTGNEWDSSIAAIGRGAAGAMEKRCNRKFGRVEGDTYTCRADVPFVVLPRYPVEAVSKVEIRRTYAEGWVELTDVIANLEEAAGLVFFERELGGDGERLRITFTGGYWIDEADDGSVTDDRTWQQGLVDLDVDAESVAITFASAFGDEPAVNPTVVPPAGGLLIQAVPSEITASGFMARLGFPIPAAGYKLQWTALLSTPAAPSAGSMPSGAVAMPAALQHAWLQQCAHLWRQKDKLGSALASNNGEAVAMQVDLAPGVPALLAPFIRYDLL